jgi:hypothetical protein
VESHAWRCPAGYPLDLFIGQAVHESEQVFVHEAVLPGNFGYYFFGHFVPHGLTIRAKS